MKTAKVIALVAACFGGAVWALNSPDSGLAVGKMLPAYDPVHVAGPDKGTNTCPVCKYGPRPAVQVWVNGDSAENVAALAKFLEKTVGANKAKDMKAFVVFLNTSGKSDKAVSQELTKMAEGLGIKEIAFAYLPAAEKGPIQAYAINTDSAVKNTIFVYRNRKVAAKFVNLKADSNGLTSLNKAISSVLN